jgi:hypothetical protein
MNIGVFTCDPGGATGLAWAILNPLAREGVGEALRTKMNHGSTTVDGNPRKQIREIASLWSAFYRTCVKSACLPEDRVFYVCENYIYAPGVNYEGESAMISTALIWGVEGYRMGRGDEWKLSHPRGRKVLPPMILQTASEAKSYATSARLKEWDCWVVGREHERSAYQHMAYFLKSFKIKRPNG